MKEKNYAALLQRAAGEHYLRFSDIYLKAARVISKEKGLERPLFLEDCINPDRTADELNEWAAKVFEIIEDERAEKQSRYDAAKAAGEFADSAPIGYCERAKTFAEEWLDRFEGYLEIDEGYKGKGLHLVAHKEKRLIEDREAERDMTKKMLERMGLRQKPEGRGV